ncbi:MAG TPA: alpha/beta hydrolase [Alphaproteobacteria bacterium]|jgi:epsilon-lactone hydrolase|nr:alpha/beta hydrolase [Alphaproteobacteria bacterium]
MAMPIEKLVGIMRKNAAAAAAAAASSGPSGKKVTMAMRREGMEKTSFPVAPDVKVEKLTVAGRDAEWIRAPGVKDGYAILYLHGGGYVMGSLNTHRALAGEISRAARAAVLLLDYRLAPENKFPAAVEDGVAGFKFLLAQGYAPEKIAIGGDSAGGGLTAATLVALRDEKSVLPAAGVLISPWSDLTCTNPSYKTRAEADPMIGGEGGGGLDGMSGLYLQGASVVHPHASPNFADLTGLPPLLIHVGDAEVLLDDSIRLHDKAKACGVDSTLEVWPKMIHVWHAFHPMLDEGKQGIERIGEYLRGKWGM